MRISAVAPGGSAGDQTALEQVSFSFGSSIITVVRQNDDGKPGGEETAVLCGSSKGRWRVGRD